MTQCEHIRQVCTRGKWTCKACGQKMPTKRRDWSSGKAPTVFMRGGRAKVNTTFFTPSRGDVKPHFNRSLGEFVTSRKDMLEKAHRKGLRPVTPDEIGKPEDSIAEARRCRERTSEAIANPKVPLRDVYYREEVAAPLGQDIR